MPESRFYSFFKLTIKVKKASKIKNSVSAYYILRVTRPEKKEVNTSKEYILINFTKVAEKITIVTLDIRSAALKAGIIVTNG